MENINGNIYDIKDGIVYCKSVNSDDVIIFEEKYFTEVSKYKWRRSGNQIYACPIINGKSVAYRIDRLIYELEYGPIEPDMQIYHINEDFRDCIICNLYKSWKNNYEFDGDIVYGYTNNSNTRFKFDKKYFSEVRKHAWNTNLKNTISTHYNYGAIGIGRFIYELENGPVEFGAVRYKNGNQTDATYENLYVMDNRNIYRFEGNIAIGKLFNYDHEFIIDKDMYEYVKDYIFGFKFYPDGSTSNIITRTSKYCYSLFYLVLKWHGIDPGNAKVYPINGDKYDCRFCNIGILRNEYDIVGDIAYGHIPTSDLVYIVDARFVPEISNYKCIDRDYIIIYYKRKKIKLHRLVCELVGINLDGLVVHHINGNKYDNRLYNLFVCTPEMHNDIHNYGLEVYSNINTLLGLNNSKVIHPFIFI